MDNEEIYQQFQIYLYQILQIDHIWIVCQAVGRITYEILGVKG